MFKRPKLRLAICTSILALLCGTLAIAAQIYSVTVGDVVINRSYPIIRGPNGMHSLAVSPDRDPRFIYSHPLKGVVVFFEEGQRNGQYDDVVSTSKAEPNLYPAPLSMSVFRHPINNTAAII